MARKTATSTEVKARWNAANYRRYQVYLRVDDDADLIQWIEHHKADTGTTDLFRAALEKLKNESR